MRNRLPEPKPRIGTLMPVRPSMRVGSLPGGIEPSAGAATSPMATASRNCRRFIRGGQPVASAHLATRRKEKDLGLVTSQLLLARSEGGPGLGGAALQDILHPVKLRVFRQEFRGIKRQPAG